MTQEWIPDTGMLDGQQRRHDTMENVNADRMRAVTAEMRAGELLTALSNAVSGAPHWRRDAQHLLALIDAYIPPRKELLP